MKRPTGLRHGSAYYRHIVVCRAEDVSLLTDFLTKISTKQAYFFWPTLLYIRQWQIGTRTR